MDKDKLKRVTVIITRPEAQAPPLVRAVTGAGGKAVCFPGIEIVPVPQSRQSYMRKQAATLRAGDWAIFVSPNAAAYGLALLPGGALPAGVRAAAVGSGTAGELKRRGIKSVTTPAKGYNSEALLTAPALRKVAGKRFVIFAAPGGRLTLRKDLRRRGAKVILLAVYRRLRPEVPRTALAGKLPKRGRIVTTVTSAGILHNLMTLVDAHTYLRMQRSPLIVISARLKGLAEWAGFQQVHVAGGPGTNAILEAVAQASSRR